MVTVPDGVSAESGAGMHHQADLSPFFDNLPPSLRGTPNAASDPGSGSTSMAEEMGRAVRRQEPLLTFDEDRAAVHLLIPSCLSAPGVVPLSTLVATRRERLGATNILDHRRPRPLDGIASTDHGPGRFQSDRDGPYGVQISARTGASPGPGLVLRCMRSVQEDTVVLFV